MKKRLFPLLIALSALAVSGSAAFYSVFGLSKLFAGASNEVIIMAGSLEFAKLVAASLLYQYWDTINKWLRSYLAIAVFVLMVITSGGIYGFLSGAYQTTATQSELLDKSLLILEQKQIRFEETKKDLTLEKTQINKSISDLRVSLSNPHQVSWYDKNSETVITSSSSSARRALQAELDNTKSERINLNLKLEAVLDSINKTDMALLEKEISNEDQRELGPLKYLAKTTGWPMDKVVNYFLLLIVFVFDPLAIALVVAANMAFAQINPKRKEEDYFVSRNKHIEDILDYDDEDNHYGERMDIIGQNGNDGLHYEDEQKEEDNTTEPSESLKQRVKENQEKLNKDTVINTYGDDEWATPTEEEITIDGGEIEVTVEPTEEQMKELVEKELIDDEEYFTDLEQYIKFTKEEVDPELVTYPNFVKQHYHESDTEDSKLEEYTGEPERLTDTTQTLIVEELDNNSEETQEDEKQNEKPTRVLRYTKDR